MTFSSTFSNSKVNSQKTKNRKHTRDKFGEWKTHKNIKTDFEKYWKVVDILIFLTFLSVLTPSPWNRINLWTKLAKVFETTSILVSTIGTIGTNPFVEVLQILSSALKICLKHSTRKYNRASNASKNSKHGVLNWFRLNLEKVRFQ